MSENTHPDSPETQEALLRVTAEAGDTQAMDKLGELLEDRGEIFEAEAWYRKAAELGNNSAMNDLGLMFEGRKEFTEAEHWFLLSANNGNVRGMNNLAIFYEDRGRPVEAESWYRKAGDLGFPAAVNNLGFLLSNQGRSDEAKEQYLKAINLGHENAMINLAITHANLGEVQDAERWYRKAVDLGNLQAMNNLALLLKDRGDLVEAEQLLHQGIALNSNKAMNNLAQMCIERGDLVEAEKWFLKSIEVENNTFAVNGLARVREEIAKSSASSGTSCVSCGTKRSSPHTAFCEECGTKFEPEALSKEEEVANNIFRELSKEKPDPLAIPPMLSDDSLDKDYLRDIIDSWSIEMVDKYHQAVLDIAEWRKFIQDGEESEQEINSDDPEVIQLTLKIKSWANTYEPLCVLENFTFVEAPIGVPENHLWTEFCTAEYDYFYPGFIGFNEDSDSYPNRYVITKNVIPQSEKEVVVTTLYRPCMRCDQEGEVDEEPCPACNGDQTHSFNIDFDFPVEISSQEELEAFIKANQGSF